MKEEAHFVGCIRGWFSSSLNTRVKWIDVAPLTFSFFFSSLNLKKSPSTSFIDWFLACELVILSLDI